MQTNVQSKDKTTTNFLNIGKIEGYSYLLLLFIAMPLKYGFGMPQAVQIVGLLHGVLFIAFIVFIVQMMEQKKLTLIKAVYAFLLSIIPFGTFFLKKLL